MKYHVEVKTRTRTIIIGTYTDPEHARRDCVLQRISYPRADMVSARTSEGTLLLGLRRRRGA